jgi:spore maturation protein CgeB
VLAIGGLHVPKAVLERLASLPSRPPLVGWVGDTFDESARAVANHYDLIAYTDTGLARRHVELGFAAPTVFAPHAINPDGAAPAAARAKKMVFVANPTPVRRAVVEAIARPIAIFGPGWPASDGHEVHARRLPARSLGGVYARHLASLNVRNEFNVLCGLNQRNFQPYLTATPVLTDDQPDLALCFDPGAEVLVWRDAGELNAIYERLLAAPDDAARVGAAGRARLLAEHTYGRRLRLIAGLI